MDMQNIDAQVDALLTDPVTANKYLSYFDKDRRIQAASATV